MHLDFHLLLVKAGVTLFTFEVVYILIQKSSRHNKVLVRHDSFKEHSTEVPVGVFGWCRVFRGSVLKGTGRL